ncbi:MAG TPA: glucose-6-phosphate isomerase [Xanthomonadaceae bacterium]|nr:glucose-6-phosphate isomerase [Xanthomonadaceae bacterium]
MVGGKVAVARDLAAALRDHARRSTARRIPELIAAEPGRAGALSVRAGPLQASFARQRYDRAALDALLAIAGDAELAGALRAQFGGDVVNPTERRAALHVALRGLTVDTPVARQAHADATAARASMRALVDGLAATEVTDVVSVGIGGSDLGPRLVADALALPGARFRLHFLSNVDGTAAQRVLAGLDPARTAAILVSKTFGTQETLLNGAIVRDWLGEHVGRDGGRVFGVSANVERAAAFGIDPARILPMWDWVGGRYSLWSAVGFPIALAIGMDRFEALLAGAATFDRHALEAPAGSNLAVLHALTAAWNRNGLGATTHAVLPYDERLRLLPAYLQQLVMESLGKSARLDGSPVAGDTVPVWWGGTGTDVQHSFFQALHQGTNTLSADFIGVIDPGHPHDANRDALHANLLAQAEALANGQSNDDAHRHYPGGTPSTMLLLDALTPESLGALLALYEHSTYLQGVLWGINPFDQFGVELGKQLANKLLPALNGDATADDPVTRALIAHLQR